MNIGSFQPNQLFLDATITSGTDEVAFNTLGTTLSEVVFPATMTNTAFDIQKSYDNGANYKDVYNSAGVKITVTVVDGCAKLDPSDSYNLSGFLKLKGASNEGAERALIIVVKPL